MTARVRGDRGVVLPIVAISMVALITVLAIIIDLGYTRSIRAGARSAADSGSTAGAVALGDASDAQAACQDAFAYTFESLDVAQPSTIASACSAFATACVPTAIRTTPTLTSEGISVSVSNPVPDGNALMNGTSLGNGVPQTVDPSVDGAPCDRVGVQVTRSQGSFFRGIMGSTNDLFTVHSVAVKINKPGKGETTPALVALNQSACKAIDAGQGEIWLIGNAKGPGIGVSDSNGDDCSRGPILSGGSSGHLCAESSSSVGELQWFEAPPAKGYSTGDPVYSQSDAVCANAFGGGAPLKGYRYIGSLSARTKRITRVPVDTVYRCSTVTDPDTGQPFCAPADDPIKTLETLSNSSGSSAPSGYTTFPGPGFSGDCGNTAGTTFSSNTWVNCPSFSVDHGIVSITNGATVIFTGNLFMGSNGDLRANAGTAVDADGYPIPLNSADQTTIIINGSGQGAFDMQSTAFDVRLAQTTVFTKGGLSISGSPTIRWTPPTSGGTTGLLYWSEAGKQGQKFVLSGSPKIFAKGVFFQGNGALEVSGGGLIDLTKVQMWVDTIAITNGGGGVKLSADPETAITVGSPGSALIR